MAVIGSIRKRSALLVIIIGVALAAFVLGDFTMGRRSGRQDMNVGIVEGEKITYTEFNYKVDQNIQATKQQQNKERLTPEETFQMQNDTWNQMVTEILLKKEYEELGLDVTVDELDDLIRGANPHPLIIQSFTDPNTGMFDRSYVSQFIANLDKQTAETQQQWMVFEEFIRTDRLRAKYNAMISKGYYIPSALAKMAFEDENNKANIQYISKKFVDVNDSLINPTDEDFDQQYEKNLERYKQEPYREFDYVVFDIKPSQRDLEAGEKEMNSIYEEFKRKQADEVERFVLINSDTPYDSSWKAKGSLPIEIDSIMFNSEIGTVVEPYLDNNTFYTARLVDIAQRPDSMKARHILIAYKSPQSRPEVTRTRAEAEQLVDSLAEVLKNNKSKFTELAKQFSDDPSAAMNDGDLGWFFDGRMVPEFNEAVLNTDVGSITTIGTQFGYHVIDVTGKKDYSDRVRVAVVQTEVIPSNETYQSIFAQASKLASENRTLEEFDAAVEEDGLNVRSSSKVREMSNRIGGLNSPRQIIRWAFGQDRQIGEVEVGDVSNVFDLDGQFVVAVLTKKADEEYPPIDEIREGLEIMVKNELKGELIANEMESMSNDFEKLEAAGFTKTEMSSLTFNSRNLLGYGTEYEVIGKSFGSEEGDVFGPVIGKAGTFIVKVDQVTKASEQDDYLSVINKLQSGFENRVNQGYAYRAIEEVSDVEDRRIAFY
jgi:peptidyl-prolyl cis-trans isomerase D